MNKKETVKQRNSKTKKQRNKKHKERNKETKRNIKTVCLLWKTFVERIVCASQLKFGKDVFDVYVKSK